MRGSSQPIDVSTIPCGTTSMDNCCVYVIDSHEIMTRAVGHVVLSGCCCYCCCERCCSCRNWTDAATHRSWFELTKRQWDANGDSLNSIVSRFSFSFLNPLAHDGFANGSLHKSTFSRHQSVAILWPCAGWATYWSIVPLFNAQNKSRIKAK